MERIKIKDSVSKTLFITAYHKAKENEHKNPILKDEFSKELIQKIDFDYLSFKNAPFSSIGINYRARYFDEKCVEFIKNSKNPVIVMVGSGLDTRYLRIGGEKLQAYFYELDLPEVIELRKKLLPNGKNSELISSSMFDTKWMDTLASKHQNSKFLFLIEGVLMYFDEKEVKSFFINLASRFQGEILCDLINIWMSQNTQKHDCMKAQEAKFNFGIDDERSIQTWHKNLTYIKTDYIMKQKPTRKSFFIFVGKLLSNIKKFRDTSKMVTFSIG